MNRKSPIKNQNKARDLAPVRRSPWLREIQAEVLEPRLVLSAQAIFDLGHAVVLDHQPFEWDQDSQATVVPVVDSMIGNVTPQVAEAHQTTGWNSVQQQFGLHGQGQTVAVIDSGIAWDHVALGKGFGAGYRVVGGWDFAENDANPYDDAPAGFHGTHVAGIIGANGTEKGVAPDVDLVSLRVFQDNGQGNIAWTEQALQWIHTHRNAFENPITTVNLSLGIAWNGEAVPEWASLEDDLKRLYDDGIVVVAAAGNSFQQYKTAGLNYPAASPYVIPVSSVESDGQLSDFSQRSERSIAAPGRGILSTVPDHVLGRDGKVDDWSPATGTSMASPYVAGAAVLIREAMEMAGNQNITVDSIYQVLSDTSDSTWDAITSQDYHRLNLMKAIDSILPDDFVGNSLGTAASSTIVDGQTTHGWINSLGDRDVFQFTADKDGTLNVTADSQALSEIKWSAWNGTTEIQPNSASDILSLQVYAGQRYAIGISDQASIGTYDLTWDFEANSSTPQPTHPDNSPTVPQPQVASLGNIEALQLEIAASQRYQMRATHDGIFTVLLDGAGDSHTIGTGWLQGRAGEGAWQVDSTWENSQLRLDLQVVAGQTVDLTLPNIANLHGTLHLVNQVQKIGDTVHVFDSSSNDDYQLDLSSNPTLRIGAIDYQWDQSQVKNVLFLAGNGYDTLAIQGSANSENVELRPNHFNLASRAVQASGDGIENIVFRSGGMYDSVSMYDAGTNDSVIAKPLDVELNGIGYHFQAVGVERVLVFANSGGEDTAYLYDSPDDDILSVRPQFTNIRSENYFNRISGFERVFAYANAGGHDTANLYDTQGNDRFVTTGLTASIVGDNYFSYANNFESIEAFATSGGNDSAVLYASQRSSIAIGVDFASYNEQGLSRLARGFESYQTYVQNQLVVVPIGFEQSMPQVSQQIAQSSIAPLASQTFQDVQHAVDTSMTNSNNEAILTTKSHPASNNGDLAAYLNAGSLQSYGPSPTAFLGGESTNEESTSQPANLSANNHSFGTPVQDMPIVGPISSISPAAVHDPDIEMALLASMLEAHRFAKSSIQSADLDLMMDPNMERKALDAIFAHYE